MLRHIANWSTRVTEYSPKFALGDGGQAESATDVGSSSRFNVGACPRCYRAGRPNGHNAAVRDQMLALGRRDLPLAETYDTASAKPGGGEADSGRDTIVQIDVCIARREAA